MSNKHFVLHSNLWTSYSLQDPARNTVIRDLVIQIKNLNPDSVITTCGSEVGIYDIYDEFITRIRSWFETTGKKFIIFSPAMPEKFNKEYLSFVEWYQFSGYDICNFEVTTNFYLDNKPILTNPTKLFTCYNNRPDSYRTYTVDQLAKFNLLNEGIVTYRYLTELMSQIDPNWKLSDDFTYYTGTPRLVDEPDFVLHQGYKPNDLPRSYLDGFIDIVTESRIFDGEFFLSEKVNKPLMAQKPFLVVSCPHYHQWLKDFYGIEPYTELFDYEFDDLKKMEDRVDGIIKNIIRIREEYKTPADYAHLLKMLKPKLEHNLNIYLKVTATGEVLLKNIPEWMRLDQETLISDYFIRGMKDYEHEFCNLHCFIYGVINPYHAGKYQLPDISR
jgi:hypothetical protein